jgi:hypothetical protein
VEDGEVVIVGEWLINRGATLTGEYWHKEMFEAAICTAVATVVLVALHGTQMTVLLVGLAMFVLIGGMASTLALFKRRRGWPAGVLRLTCQGYQRGAGHRKGIKRAWHPGVRVNVNYASSRLRVKAVRMWGFLPLWTLFDVRFSCTDRQREGFMERARDWSRGKAQA